MSDGDGVELPAEVAAALDRFLADGAARSLVEQRADHWWRERDPRAAMLVDRIAVEATTSAVAMETLLTIIASAGVARPAIRRYLLDDHDVADAEQATLAVVGLRLRGWEGRSRFTTWLHQVAANEAKMLIRGRERRPVVPVADPAPGAFAARLSTILADRDVVERAMGRLADELRAPLVLREIDGLEYAEIAIRLDIEPGTVRSRLHRARAALVEELRPMIDEP